MTDYYRLSPEEALKTFGVNAAEGLSETTVQQRQVEYGRNALPKGEGTTILQLILNQFADVMVIILIVAAGISFFLGEAGDTLVIMVIVILNAALGVYQEYRAEQALAALSALQVALVTVRRAGKIHQINAEELVPGDIVLIEEGTRIPADGRLLQSVNLMIEEAALTGESLPVTKSVAPILAEGAVALGDRNNVVFMGTVINFGRGEMVVTETGLKTELGKIAALLLQVEQEASPLQKRLAQLGRALATGALIVVAIVFFTGLLRGIPARDMFLIAVSLAVAAVPEGLPALVTISLSLGAARMVRRNALIRRLPAVETLGSVSVICSDKTGTLTKNEMTATLLALPGHDDVQVTGIGYTPQGDFVEIDGDPVNPREDLLVGRFLKAMALSTNAHLEQDGTRVTVVGDTTEGALVVAAQKVGWTRERLEQDMPRRAEYPFSSERKAMTTVHEVAGSEAQQLFPTARYLSITKGAPDRLIEWATHEYTDNGIESIDAEKRLRWNNEVDKMASQGLRVLGVACRPLDSLPETLDDSLERNLALIGLVGIVDPARPEAKAAVDKARSAGIRSIMITGDHALTAEAIARNLGIITDDQHAVTGNQLDQMNDQQLLDALRQTSAFARVSPQHKLRIVQALQSQDAIVAMTGDGVNDAPALKQADIGVAMGITGTDVSKGAAEMVLTDDNFASIVAAVEEGRAIYDNIRKFIKYLLASNVGEILVMFTALLTGLKIPLLAIQILWVNLVTDGLPAIALGFEKPEPGVMERKPRPINENVFAGGIGIHIVWVGGLIAVLTLTGFILGFVKYGMSPFSPSLGLETFTRAELIVLVDEDLVPEDWDSLSEAEHLELLESSGTGLEQEESPILSEAQRIPQTMAFALLAFAQMFEVGAIHAGNRSSFFRDGFGGNRLLLGAVLLTFVLQLAVIYLPFMQSLFHTAALGVDELLITLGLALVVLFGVEIEKVWLVRTGRG